MTSRQGASPLPWERAYRRAINLHAAGHDEDSPLLLTHLSTLRNELRALDMHPDGVAAIIRQALIQGLERRKGQPIKEVNADPVRTPLHPRWREGSRTTPLDQKVEPQRVVRDREVGPDALPPRTTPAGRRPHYDDGPRRLQVMWAAEHVGGTLVEGMLIHGEPDDKLALIMVYAGGHKPLDERFVVWRVRNRGGFVGADIVGSSDTKPHAHVHYIAARLAATRVDPAKKRPKMKFYKAPSRTRKRVAKVAEPPVNYGPEFPLGADVE